MASSLYKSFSAYIKSITKWEILVFLFILMMILCFIKRDLSCHAEGFEQQSKYKIYENDTIYDSFYADIYDELFIQPNKIEAEVDEIIISLARKRRIRDLRSVIWGAV